jgi:hypothetical protein
MKFERSDISMIRHASEADIIEEFNKFGEDMDDFVVLSQNDMNYIQSALSDFEGEGFILEYQEASLDKHFSATDKNISKDDILSVFLAYLKGDSSWKEKFNWEITLIEDEDF